MIFIAAPLFSEAERRFNTILAERLRSEGYEVWLAQEDGLVQSGDYVGKKRIYKKDLDALDSSDIIVAVLDGVDVDSGTAFEIGYGVAKGKPVIGLKTDHRTFSYIESVNLMIEVAVIKLCRDIDELLRVLIEHPREKPI